MTYRGPSNKVRLPKYLLDRIEPQATKQGITVSRWVRVAVERLLDEEERA